MSQEVQPQPRDSRRTFLRVVGIVWGVVVLVTLIGALLAPHLGRMMDFVLHQTTHRHWTRLTLRTAQPFFDLSTPEHAVKSYYSALYRADATAMERLTADPFRARIRLRLSHAEAVATDTPTYRSYLQTEIHQAQSVLVVEKFHLFWRRGLHFHLKRSAADWHITGVDLMR